MTLSHAHPHSPSPQSAPAAHPVLETGDRLDQPTFHARYAAMPSSFRAELIGGTVHVPSPLKTRHGGSHGEAMAWAVLYKSRTPGTLALDNTTHILAEDSEVQPDVSLLVIGGQTKVSDEDYVVGAPELIVEVASSTVSIDLHAKKRDYEKYGVQEYVVVAVRDALVTWFVRDGDRFVEMPADANGVHRSRVFPGLWLDGPALLRGDTTRVLAVLEQGLATPEYATFRAALAARANPS